MKQVLITKLITFVLTLLTEDQVREMARTMIRAIKAQVKNSDSELDDRIALPLIQVIESAFNLEENNDEKKI